MKIIEPKVVYLEETDKLLQEIEFAILEEIDVKNKEFKEIDINQTIKIEKVEFSCCKFTDCKLLYANMNGVYFTDTIFENCDFSNASFEKSNFVRCQFHNCKLIGANFVEANFYHVRIVNCVANYCNCTMAKLENVLLGQTLFRSASFEEVILNKVEYDECDLRQSQFFKTKLKGIDFSNSIIEAIVVSIEDLKGVIVNSLQALELTKLLEIKIKE